MVSNMMKMVWILVAAWCMRGIDSVDDESDVSHRRRRELGHHVHGDLYDAASSDSAPLEEPADDTQERTVSMKTVKLLLHQSMRQHSKNPLRGHHILCLRPRSRAVVWAAQPRRMPHMHRLWTIRLLRSNASVRILKERLSISNDNIGLLLETCLPTQFRVSQ